MDLMKSTIREEAVAISLFRLDLRLAHLPDRRITDAELSTYLDYTQNHWWDWLLSPPPREESIEITLPDGRVGLVPREAIPPHTLRLLNAAAA
jgi:hypothetical protein